MTNNEEEKVKEDVLKNPKHILVTIQILLLQRKSVYKSYKEFCAILGDDVMEYKDFDFWWYRFLDGEFDLEYDRSKEPKKREMGDMPIKIVEKIVRNLEKEDRYPLPNVSKQFRNVMEESNLLISDLSFSFDCDKIKLSFNGRKITINAMRGFFRCDEKWVPRDHLAIGLKHLSRILKNPYLRFDTFRVDFKRNHIKVSEYSKAVEEAFKSMTHQIHVENLELKVICEEQLMAILPYLKPGVLETIEISSEKHTFTNITSISELKQFKQAKSFTLKHFYFNAPIENLFHFNRFEIRRREITEKNLIDFKHAFLASPIFKKCYLHFDGGNANDFRQIQAEFDKKVFAIPDSTDSLLFQVSKDCVLIERAPNRALLFLI